MYDLPRNVFSTSLTSQINQIWVLSYIWRGLFVSFNVLKYLNWSLLYQSIKCYLWKSRFQFMPFFIIILIQIYLFIAIKKHKITQNYPISILKKAKWSAKSQLTEYIIFNSWKKWNEKFNNHTWNPGRVYQFTYQRIIRLIADISGYGQGEKWPVFA